VITLTTILGLKIALVANSSRKVTMVGQKARRFNVVS
jgi:hypothetical protein